MGRLRVEAVKRKCSYALLTSLTGGSKWTLIGPHAVATSSVGFARVLDLRVGLLVCCVWFVFLWVVRRCCYASSGPSCVVKQAFDGNGNRM